MTGGKRDLGAVRIGSLCSGYGGLELGLMAVVGGTVDWHAEIDKHPAAVLDARFPGVPNLGDITTTDWTQVEPVDWLTAGYPCQPFSHAGKRKGSADERHLWPFVADAIGALRPRRVLLENVAGHVSLGLDAVLWDLAALGYDATWGVVRAADAGAPHARARLFIVAADTRRERHGGREDGRGVGRVDSEDAGSSRQREWSRPEPGDRSAASAADASGGPLAEPAVSGDGLLVAAQCGDESAPADAQGDGRDEGWPEPAWQLWRPDAAVGCDATCVIDRDWRTSDGDDYGPAIRRWHDLTRCVPEPTEPHVEGRRRLNPRFVEWMQGLPAGHVTDVLPRNPALKALGNGVVPQQAEMAVRALLPRALAVAA